MAFKAVEFKVGLLVIAVAVLIAWMSFKVSEGPGLFGGGTKYYFMSEDAGGLIEKSAVKIAGIKVGLIQKIELVDGMAKVTVLIDDGVTLYSGAYISVKADGILGDRHVEVFQGSMSASPIKAMTKLPFKGGSGSLDTIAEEVGKITDSLSEFAKNLNEAAGMGDETTRIGRILKNIEDLSADLQEISSQNKSDIRDIVTNVKSVSVRLDNFLADGDGQFSQAWSDIRDIIHRFDNTMKNFENISHKINDGSGTIGQLINDDTTINGINETIESVNEFVGNAIELETSIDYHTEFMSEEDRNKNYLSVRITPGLDRYYELGIVTDPLGLSRRTRTVTTGSTSTDVTETRTFFDRLKFTALFAKNIHNFTLKGGVIESKGGVGFDYYLMDNDFRFSIEAFDFDDLFLRSFIRYNVYNGIYVTVGGDNLLGSRDVDAAAFIGAGLLLTNDDLKILATRLSF